MTERQHDEGGRRKRLPPMEGTPVDAGEVPGWTGRIMVWLRVIAQFAGIQLLMVAGTVLGLGILGLGPATASGARLLRRIVDGDASDALWKDFWGGYRADFRRAAVVTVPFIVVIGLAWYELLVLLYYGEGTVAAIFTGAIAAIGAYAVACLAYAPHVLRRYSDAPLPTLRFVALAPLLSPLTALGCIVTTVALMVVFLNWVPLFILMGLSVPLLLSGLIVDRWLDKIDARSADA
ncbi:YesL family protein [Demequina rhizosphaerae]|uniref:YesL family protein n=1 Tax=Demequina rhizosphaerae TaxID=1638985 RepID=UPI0014702E27|nr:YesL family protein [Demequina rhizosphaerae]